MPDDIDFDDDDLFERFLEESNKSVPVLTKEEQAFVFRVCVSNAECVQPSKAIEGLCNIIHRLTKK